MTSKSSKIAVSAESAVAEALGQSIQSVFDEFGLVVESLEVDWTCMSTNGNPSQFKAENVTMTFRKKLQ